MDVVRLAEGHLHVLWHAKQSEASLIVRVELQGDICFVFVLQSREPRRQCR